MEILIESLIWHDAVIQLIETNELDNSLKMRVSFTNFEQPFSKMCLRDVVSAVILFNKVNVLNTLNIKILLEKKQDSWEAEVLSSNIRMENQINLFSLFVKIENDETKDEYLEINFIYESGRILSIE